MAGDPVESSLWCRGTFVVGVEGLGQRRHVTFSQPFVRCGSLDTCDLRLHGPGIPRRLLYLHAVPEGIFAVPLVAPGRFAPLPSGWLLPKISLHVGPFRISWQWDCLSGSGQARALDPAHLPSLVDKGSSKQHWNLDIFVDGHRVGRYELSRVLTIVGRHSPSHLVMTSRSVSGCHCIIVAEEDRLWFVDLCSGNGSRLEGQHLDAAEWPVGAALQLGRVTLVAKPSSSRSGAMHQVGVAQESFDDLKAIDPASSGGQSGSQLSSAHENLSTPAREWIRENTEIPLTGKLPAVNTPNHEAERVEEPEPDIPTFFTPPCEVRIKAFDLDVLESVRAPEVETSRKQPDSQPVTVVESDRSKDDGETKTVMETPSLLGRYDSLTVQHEFVHLGCHPELVGTEIIVEDDMQDNPFSAQAKDYVLRLFADGFIDDHIASLAIEAPEEPQESLTFSETPESTQSFVSGEKTTSHHRPSIGDLEKKTQELIIKEQILAAWAKTLDQMSEAILRLQEELVAEEDRFAEQQQSLAERERQLTAWHDELESRADKLSRGEQELLRRQRELEEKERAVQERHQILRGELQSLAEESHRLRLLREECNDRAEKLSALELLLSERERNIQQKEDAIAAEEASLKQWADRLAEEEAKLHALHQDLEGRMNGLATREQDLALRETALQEKMRQLANWEESLNELRQTSLRQEHDLKERFDELTRWEQNLTQQQQELEKKRQSLIDQEQSLATQMRELTLRIQQLGEKERQIADQIRELQDRQARLQQWELRLREQESILVATQDLVHEENTAVLSAATGRECDRGISLPTEFQSPQRLEPETSTFEKSAATASPAAVAVDVSERPQPSFDVTVPRAHKVRQTKEWQVIPLAKIRRRWRVSAPFAVGLPTVLLVACLVWWIYPRQFVTACRIGFPEGSPLLYVRDGAWPGEASKELFPQLKPVAPNSPEVVERLRQDAQIKNLPSDEKLSLDQVLASVGVSRSEGLPFTTLSFASRHPEMARQILEKWSNIYVAFLVESLDQKMKPALARAEAEWQRKSQQLSEVREKIQNLKAQYAADNPRQIEFQARESLQMAELTEKEIEQLTAEIKVHTERLEETKAAVNNPDQAITENELLKALTERIQQEGLPPEESQPNQRTAPAAENNGGEFQGNGHASANNSNTPQSQDHFPDKSRYAMLRELVRNELIERKRQDAILTVQVLEAELQRLQSRLQVTQDRKSQYEALAQSLQDVAAKLGQLETEGTTLERDCEQLRTRIATLEKALSQSKMRPQLEVWCTQRQPWIPIAFAALAGGMTMIPFGLWWLIRSRRVTMLFPPAAFEHEEEHPRPKAD